MLPTLDVPCRAAAWVRQWCIGSCRSEQEQGDRARPGQAADLTMPVFDQHFFGAGLSPRHIGGGRSSATAVELALCHRDEIQSAGRVLPAWMEWASHVGWMVICQFHKARARTVYQRSPMPVWWHRFPQP